MDDRNIGRNSSPAPREQHERDYEADEAARGREAHARFERDHEELGSEEMFNRMTTAGGQP
jgi:hypothetical protein